MKTRLLLTALLIILCVANTFKANAQTFYSSRVKSIISKEIKLSSGAYTVDNILLAVQKQSGIKIEMSPYLRGHIIYMNLSQLSLQSLLNSICAMNHWSWYESVTPGTIVIKGYKTKPVASLNELPECLRSDMTAGFQRFIAHTSHPLSMQKVYESYLFARRSAEKANDKISAYIYQRGMTLGYSTVGRNLQYSANLMMHSLTKSQPTNSTTVPANLTGSEISPKLQRIILLNLIGTGINSLGDSGRMLGIVPSYLYFWPKTQIILSSSPGSFQLSCQLNIKSHGNEAGDADQLLDSNPNDLPYP